MDKGKRYFAFISYKREDEEWAKWLQHKLEHYKLPSNLNGRSDLPKEIRPIFRDKSDLAGGVLAEEINDALENSQYLIVICSPHAAHSEWVSKEVKAFIDMGRSDKIIPFIIGGTAHAQNPEEECFPVTLREMPADQELLGVNINEMGRDAAAVKVVAQMFGLKFDELWQRWEREQKRRRNWIVAASVIGFLLMAGVAGWIWWQYREIKEKDWKMMENQSRFVAEKALSLLDEGDKYMAQRLLIDVFPKYVKSPDRPMTTEAEFSMMKVCLSNSFILGRHNDCVSSATFSPDGRHVVSTSDDYTVKIWNVSDGQCLKVINEHAENKKNPAFAVRSAVYSPDGQVILYTTEGNVIYAFDVETELTNPILNGEKAVFSPDGRYIAVSDYKTIYIWDLYMGYCANTLKGHDNRIESIAFDNVGRRLVSSDDSSIRIWNLANGLCEDTIIGNNVHYIDAVFALDNKYIVSASWDNTIRVWDVATGCCADSLIGHANKINSVAFSPDGKYLVSASNDKTVRLWDMSIKECKKVLLGHNDRVSSAKFSPDGKFIVSASVDNTVRVWDINDKSQCLFNIEKCSKFDHYITYSLDKKYCAITYGITTEIWDVEKWQCLYTIDGHIHRVDSYAFSPDCTHVASSLGEYIYIWNIATGRCVDTLRGHTGSVNFASYSPDGKSIVSSSWEDMTIRIWDSFSGQCIDTLKGHDYYINSAVFSPDNKHIASTSCDQTVKIWDVTTRRCNTLDGHTMCVYSAFFSPDGKYIVSASWDNTARVWDVASGQCVQTLEGHGDLVYSAIFNNDGSRIITASKNGTIRVWAISTDQWRCVDILEGHEKAVNFASFGSDDNHIVSVSDDGTIRNWYIPPLQDLIDQTRERFKDCPLTDEERRMYYLE